MLSLSEPAFLIPSVSPPHLSPFNSHYRFLPYLHYSYCKDIAGIRAFSYFILSSWDPSIVNGEKEYETLAQHA